MGARGTKPKQNAAAGAGRVSAFSANPPRLKGGKEAEAEYRRVAKELVKLGHLTCLQRQTLVDYCEAWQIARNCLDEVTSEGVTLQGETGNKYIHPALNAWSMAVNKMDAAGKALGMTPLSLQSIKAVKTKPDAKKKVGPSEFLR